MWSDLQDQAYVMLPFFSLQCQETNDCTYIHTLKMLGKRKEGNAGENGHRSLVSFFLLCTDYIQYLLFPRDLPERTPPEKSREIRNSEVIMSRRHKGS